MSFMPSAGSLVRLKDGRIGIVTNVTPKGDDDRVWDGAIEQKVTAWEIEELLHEAAPLTSVFRAPKDIA